jgi:hypothetical protein
MTFANQTAATPAPTPALPAPPAATAQPPERPAAPPAAPPAPPTVDDAPATVDETLVTILSWKRPHESKSEIDFCTWLHGEITRRGASFEVKAMGCIVVTVGSVEREVTIAGKPEKRTVLPSTLFSCHVDTVHSEAVGMQRLTYDPSFGHIFLDKKYEKAGSCLGADDGAGIWLMLEMISAKVPGVYVFHRGEERGGIGSRAMLATHKDWLEEFDVAVAFDRADNDEVITHQGTLRCASDKFGEALIAQLAEHGLAYKLSKGGVFTDTKVYRGVISECINLGVGYKFQHSQDEYLDYGHLVKLRDAVIKVQWDKLPADRDPLAADPVPSYTGYGGRWGGHYAGQSSRWDDDDPIWGRQYGATPAPSPSKPGKKGGSKGGGRVHQFPKKQTSLFGANDTVREPSVTEEVNAMTLDELSEIAMGDPEAILRIVVGLAEENAALEGRVHRLRRLLKLD